MTTRDDIAAAASSVEGVECSPFYRPATEPGAAWVERTRTVYTEGMHPSYGALPFWRVTVVMPSDVVAAEEWIETYQQTLVEALSDAMAVTVATPETVQLVDNPALKVLTIDGHS